MPLFIIILGILLLFILIAHFKLNAFITFIIVSLFVGIAEGMEPLSVVDSTQKGIGNILGFLVILGLGAMLGKLVADSGASQGITTKLVDKFGKKNIQWAVVLTGFIVGIPMFYSVGFVILAPLVFTIAGSGALKQVLVDSGVSEYIGGIIYFPINSCLADCKGYSGLCWVCYGCRFNC